MRLSSHALDRYLDAFSDGTKCFAVMDLMRGFRTRRVRATYLHDRADSLRAMDRRLYVCARRARLS